MLFDIGEGVMIKVKDCWIETYTGKRFHILDPQPEEIDIRDIAHAESLLCRYTGQVRAFYSVGDHSIRAAALAPEHLALAFLLHDASEAYISDISRGLKQALPQYRDIEHIVQNAIHDKFGIKPLTLTEFDLLKEIDNILLVSEARDLLPNSNWQDWLPGTDIQPLDKTITPFSPELVEALFLETFNEYYKPS